MSGWGNVQLEECPVGEIIAWANVWSGKCQLGEVSVGEFSSQGCVSREVSVGEMSSRGSVWVPLLRYQVSHLYYLWRFLYLILPPIINSKLTKTFVFCGHQY